jgi:hypothetical protein
VFGGKSGSSRIQRDHYAMLCSTKAMKRKRDIFINGGHIKSSGILHRGAIGIDIIGHTLQRRNVLMS